MLRNLVIWPLLVPMLLNGLWVVCNDTPSKAPPAASSQAQSEQSADCIKTCAMKHQANAGTLCVVLPSDARTSVIIFDFGMAILPLEVQAQPLAAEEQFVGELPAFYSNLSVSNDTPPPRT